MISRAVLLILIGICGGCATGPVTRPARHAVLDEEHRPTGATWRPTEAEIVALENDLGKLWVRPDGRMRGRTGHKLSDYLVRYHGIEAGGRRIIVGEGECVRPGLEGAFLGEERDTVVLRSFGGGDMSFEVRYDVAAKRVLAVSFGAAL